MSRLLWELIKGLDKGEKAFFTSYSNALNKSNKSTTYQALFKAFDKMKQYKEPQLYTVVNKNQLSYQKYYLENTLINALSIYHASYNEDAKFRAALANIALLLNKKHFDLAKKYIKQTNKKMEQLQNYVHPALQFELQHYTIDIESKVPTFHRIDKQHEHLNQLKSKLEFIENELHQFTKLKYGNSLYELVNKHGAILNQTNNIYADEAKSVIENLANEDLDAAHFYNKDIIIGLRGIYENYVLENSKAKHEQLIERLDLFKQFPSFMQEKPSDFIALYSNLLQVLILQHNKSEFEKYNSELAQIWQQKLDKKSNLQLHFVAKRVYVLINLISCCLNDFIEPANKYDTFKDLKVSLAEVAQDWRKFRADEALLAYTYYFSTLLEFHFLDYEACLKACENFVQLSKNSNQLSYIEAIRIICLIQLEDEDTANDLLRSMFRRNIIGDATPILQLAQALLKHEIIEQTVHLKTAQNIKSPVIRKIFVEWLNEKFR